MKVKNISTNKIITAILVAILTVSMLLVGVTLLAPKTTEVKAAGTSATLKGENKGDYGYYGNPWYYYLGTTGVTSDNIVSITITTTASKIQGFTQGNDVSHAQDSSLYYYYKLSGTQVDTNDDGILDDNGYYVVIYADVDTIYAPQYSHGLFAGLSNCKTITFDNFDTSHAGTMESMFIGSKSLISLDLSVFDTSHVSVMNDMFGNCTSLTSLDVSSFNTSKVTDMNYMFFDCTSLTSLDLRSFNTSKVTDMNYMFGNCTSLTSLDVSSFNTSNVTDMGYMFAACTSLTSLDLSSFSFASISDDAGVEGMLGISAEIIAYMLIEEGMPLDVDEFVNASKEERITMLSEMFSLAYYDEEFSQLEEDTKLEIIATVKDMVNLTTSIPNIIAPNDLNGLNIMLAGTYEYNDGDNTQTTQFLMAGKNHTLQGYVAPEEPDKQAGVDLIDIVIMGTLTLTLAVICMAVLTVSKKRKVTNRNITLENAKKFISKK